MERNTDGARPAQFGRAQTRRARTCACDAQAEAAPFVEGAYKYVDQALQWGQQFGIGVLIDLHAANGSQNGQDNSAPTIPNLVGWNGAQSDPR